MQWEYTWQPIPREAAVVVTVRWYLHAEDAEPWWEESIVFSVADRAITDERVLSTIRDRARAVANMHQRYTRLAAALGAEAGVRLPVGGGE